MFSLFSNIPQLRPAEAAARQDALVVDVRNPEEWAYVHIEGSTLLPLPELSQRYGELPRDKPLLLLCHYGMRSQKAAMFLKGKGYEVSNISGGIDRWAKELDPEMPRY